MTVGYVPTSVCFKQICMHKETRANHVRFRVIHLPIILHDKLAKNIKINVHVLYETGPLTVQEKNHRLRVV